MSNLFVDVTRADPNPFLKSYQSYLSAAIANDQATIANTLLVWYMFLGGHVEEETFWAIDKSYAMVSSSFPPLSLLNIVYSSDSLETILVHLSTRVMGVIVDGNCFQHLDYLLVFLAAWQKRPAYLTRMVSEWHSAIGTAAGRLGLTEKSAWRQFQLQLQLQLQLKFRPQDPDFDRIWGYLSPIGEEGFFKVGRDCNPTCNTLHPAHGSPQGPIPGASVGLLLKTLEVGFHLPGSSISQSAPQSNHPAHHEWMFRTAFSSDDDEVLADAMCAWIVGDDRTSPGSCVHYLTERMGRNTPFSLRLRRLSICAIERVWNRELEGAELETVHLLNHLDVGVDDMESKDEWAQMLRAVLRSPRGLEDLTFHYWVLLDKLLSAGVLGKSSTSEDIEVMNLLEGTGAWEKLEVWLAIVWQTLPESSSRYRSVTGLAEGAKNATRKLLSQRPSALSRFDNLCRTRSTDTWAHRDALQEM